MKLERKNTEQIKNIGQNELRSSGQEQRELRGEVGGYWRYRNLVYPFRGRRNNTEILSSSGGDFEVAVEME